MRPGLSGGYDMVMLIQSETGMTLSGRTEQFKSLFKRAGLLI
jgi:hypothetical protein